MIHKNEGSALHKRKIRPILPKKNQKESPTASNQETEQQYLTAKIWYLRISQSIIKEFLKQTNEQSEFQ